MAGTTVDRKLTNARTACVAFGLAGPEDDSGLRRLLRENPLRGQVTLTLEREPDYFADASLPGVEKQTIVAKKHGQVICAGSCSVRRRFVNGQPLRVGYLGGLRLDEQGQGRFDILRRGYDFFRELQQGDPADFYFTSIASDNMRARSFLERELPGMPSYEFVGELVTLLVPVRISEKEDENGNVFVVDEVVKFLNERNSDYQFAECWTREEIDALSALGLRMEHFHGERTHGGLLTIAACWDQRSFKQTVIREYGGPLAVARPWVNLAARCLGTASLPQAGSTLANAFVSPMAVDAKTPEALLVLMESLMAPAMKRGIEFLTIGFASDEARLKLMRKKFRCREYVSRIYVVRWPKLGGSARDLNGNCLGLDVAWL